MWTSSESDLEDLYEVFNQPPSPETSVGDLRRISPPPHNQTEGAITLSDEMGIQRKQRSTFQEFLESQPGGKAPGKAAQIRPSTPPTRTHLLTPPPVHQTRADPTAHKRKRDNKGKEVIKAGRTHSSQEIDLQGGGLRTPGVHTRGRPMKRAKGTRTKLLSRPGPHTWS